MSRAIQFGVLLLAAVMLSGCPQEPPVVRPHSIAMHWDPVPAQQYAIYRGEDPQALTTNTVTTGTQYVDHTVQAGHTYYYAVSSQDIIELEGEPPMVIESDKSNVISATVPQ